MKPFLRNLFRLLALIAGLGLIPTGRVTAQTFTTLHSFTNVPSDGAEPIAGLILSGNTVYGTATSGGSWGNGTVFKVKTDGTGFTNLHIFALAGNDAQGSYTNSEGTSPRGELILFGNTLYGTATAGGSSGNGTVFKVNMDGTGFTILHSFTALSLFLSGTNLDGAYPQAGLILAGSVLYGSARDGGSSGYGTVFTVNTDGTDFRTLYSFTATSGPFPPANSDGANPDAGLILSGNTLYGMARFGGSSGRGAIFAVNTDGTGFTTLHSFTATSGLPPFSNSDGADPLAGLVLSGNTLYGTAANGGDSNYGTVFKVNTDGTGFTTLHSFPATSGINVRTNRDGAHPHAGLIVSGNTLYGTAAGGGRSGGGTVFQVNTDGTGFTPLYSFTALSNSTNSDGSFPRAGLILSGNTLYGTAFVGGRSGYGTVFGLSLGSISAPQLTITRSGANVILTWPANASTFTLQSTPSLPGTFTSISAATSPYTYPIVGARQFFRLISN
ncbi:MAG: choice-of-anchor tandem repeat GloVer-containing protein [Verrucomicrobiota bacterium]